MLLIYSNVYHRIVFVQLYVIICLLDLVFDNVCELFGETIGNVLGCGCYFVAECYGCVKCGWRCSVG